MKRLIAAIATTTLIGSVSAGSIYGGFADGNTELYPYGSHDDRMAGVQPGVGDSVASYSGTRSETSGLFSANASRGGSMENRGSGLPDIYQGFGGSADITW